MSIETIPQFFFGYTIDSSNNKINFNEGGGELTATVSAGKYSLTDFLTAIKNSLDAASTLPQSYTVSVDRSTRLITISASSNFDLLTNTGTLADAAPWTLMGFSTASDLTSTNSYTGSSASGSAYIPQFWLQNYTDSDHYQEYIQPSINESADGTIEVVSFGIRKFLEFELKFISDLPQDGRVIRNNPSGVADAVAFLQEIVKKGNFEFMADKDTPATYKKVLLESTASNSDGVGYRLKEMINDGLPNYYETGLIKLRVIT